MPFHIREDLQELTIDAGLALYSQDGIPEDEKQVIAVVESPTMGWKWTIYEAEIQGDDCCFFGRVDGFESELGYFTLSELETPGAFCAITSRMEKELEA